MANFFDEAYRERAVLSDGSIVVLRLVRPDDKALLLRGFERFSAESRYRRFFIDKDALQPHELEYLTEVDGVNHFAIGAVESGGEAEEGRGIARFVRLAERPDTAEAAIAVDDAFHGRGLGRLLFLRLCAAAHERGIARLRCDVLTFNEPMRAMILGLAPDAVVEEEGTVLSLEFPLPDVLPDQLAADAPRASPIYRLLVFAATGVVAVRRVLDKLLPK